MKKYKYEIITILKNTKVVEGESPKEALQSALQSALSEEGTWEVIDTDWNCLTYENDDESTNQTNQPNGTTKHTAVL